MFEGGQPGTAPDRATGTPGGGTSALTVGPVLMWLSLAAVAIIVTGIAGHVVQTRTQAYDAAARQAQTATQLLAENTARLFDTADFLLEDVEGTVERMSWPAIATDRALWAALRDDADRFDGIEAVWLNDARGRLRLVTLDFPAPHSIASDRDFFRHFAEGGQGPYISEPIVGRVTGRPTFLLTRPIIDKPTGTWRGIASVTLDGAYFSTFLETFALPYDATIRLVRSVDGRVLASEPAGAETTGGEETDGAAPAHLEPGMASAAIDEPDAIGWVRRLSDWPAHAVVRFDRAAIDRAWIAQVASYVVIGGLALIALVGLAGYARAVEKATRDL